MRLACICLSLCYKCINVPSLFIVFRFFIHLTNNVVMWEFLFILTDHFQTMLSADDDDLLQKNFW